MNDTTSYSCNSSGGVSVPGNHECRCVMKPGHMQRIPQAGHGCTCGAIWGREQEGGQ